MKPFGTQLSYAADVIAAKGTPAPMGDKALKKQLELASQFHRVFMQMLLSVIIAGTCLWIILHSESEQVQKWAFGTLGTILGYWLR